MAPAIRLRINGLRRPVLEQRWQDCTAREVGRRRGRSPLRAGRSRRLGRWHELGSAGSRSPYWVLDPLMPARENPTPATRRPLSEPGTDGLRRATLAWAGWRWRFAFCLM